MTTTLTLDDLDTNGTWRDVDVSERLLADYRTCTGWAGDDSLIGVLPVIGRLAHTDAKVLPPGGVLVVIGLRVRHDLRPGLHRTRMDVQRVGERNDRAPLTAHGAGTAHSRWTSATPTSTSAGPEAATWGATTRCVRSYAPTGDYRTHR